MIGQGRTADTMLKNAHLLRFPHPSSFRRTCRCASGRLTNLPAWQQSLLIRRDATLGISGTVHLDIFEHRAKNHFFQKPGKPIADCRFRSVD
jgi:hypothetical protein